jgi:hypothetical protein
LGLDHRHEHKVHRFDGVAEGLHARQERIGIESVPLFGFG